MQRNHRIMSAHTQHTEHSESSELSSEEEWHQVKNKPQRPQPNLKAKAPTADTRIIVEELVLVSDFMSELMNEEKLARDCYFGKYGPIQKSILTIKTDPPARKPTNLAFITFRSDLDAALAIAALQNYSHKSFKCLVNYGTSRYCPSFVKGIPCKITDCYFIHELQENTYTVESMRFMKREDKLQRAYDKINDNLIYYIKKEHQEYLCSKEHIGQKRNLVECTCQQRGRSQLIQLPSIRETMLRMSEEGYIDKEKYQQLKFQYKMELKAKKQKNVPQQGENQGNQNLPKPQKDQFPTIVATNPIETESGTPQASHREVNFKQEIPNLLVRYLYPQYSQSRAGQSDRLAIYYRNRQIRRKQKQGNGRKTLSTYEKMMEGPSAINSYIHHKIIQEASWTHPPQQSLFQFALKPPVSTVMPQHRKFQKIIFKSLVGV